MQDLLNEIELALKALGWSARQASIRAVGTPELIRDMRRGRVPSVERFRALCHVLDLDFYVGPRRRESEVNRHRLEQALEATEQVLVLTGRELGHRGKARVAATIYDLIGKGDGRANAIQVVQLIETVMKAQSSSPGASVSTNQSPPE